MSMMPLVSVCVPTYNGAPYLTEALESVRQQTYRPLELVIGDSGSTDDTLNIIGASEWPDDITVNILSTPTPGMVANWNRCIAEAKGEYIKFLFQDDVLDRECVAELAAALRRYPQAGLAYCRRRLIVGGDSREDGAVSRIVGYCELLDRTQHGGPECQTGASILSARRLTDPPLNKIGEPSNVMLRRNVIARVGGFSSQLRQLVDVEMWYRICACCDIAFVDKQLSSFRVHLKQESVRNSENGEGERDFPRLAAMIIQSPMYGKLHPRSRAVFREWLINYCGICSTPASFGDRLYRAGAITFRTVRHGLSFAGRWRRGSTSRIAQ